MSNPVSNLIAEYQIKHSDPLYNCTRCKLLMIDAYQTPCGCFICDKCKAQMFPVLSTAELQSHSQSALHEHFMLMCKYHLINNKKMASLQTVALNMNSEMDNTALEEQYIKLVEKIEEVITDREPELVQSTYTLPSPTQQVLLSSSIKALEKDINFINAIQWTQGSFMWTIDELDKQIEKHPICTSLTSKSFYISPLPSYYMRLRIYLNRGTDSLALFIHVNKGKYDKLLDWPYKNNLRLKLYSPVESECLTRVASPSTNIWGVPRAHNIDESTSFGFERFIPMSELSKYTINNKLFIECSVV